MAGRIREEDIASVRERASIEAVVSPYVTLKRTGASLKGLCPFHDEKGASFHVNPSRNAYKCFGCDAGGDVIRFIMEIDGLSFIEAIERLAPMAGVDLRYTESTPEDTAARAQAKSQRVRLLDAHRVAQQFYADRLMEPEAVEGRRFLSERGFRRDAAAMFGVGYSPNSWDALTTHLQAAGYTDEEIITSGLASASKSGKPVDRFRGRLMWPIRDTTGDIVGFGARKLHADDDGPKYLNTPETPIYKKSKVLFGLDLARKHIASGRKVVIVEGYTDVMACHLAGEPTAIATCGTAFGEDHVRVLRRLLDDTADAGRGEIIYTFDGDSAGQKAALRAFELDDHFQTRTYVAVEPNGMDPCDLRITGGDAAVRDLIDSRVPLFEFALKTTLARHDLSTSEGRVNALHATAPIVAGIRDLTLRPEYVGRLSRWLGMPTENIAAAVANPTTRPAQPTRTTGDTTTAPAVDGPPRPNPQHPVLRGERETLRLLIQQPATAVAHHHIVTDADYAHPAYRAVLTAIRAALTAGVRPDTHWADTIAAYAQHDSVRALINELGVAPAIRFETNRYLPSLKVDEETVARRAFHDVALQGVARRLADIKAAISAPEVTPAQEIALSEEAGLLIDRRVTLTAELDAL